MKRFDAGDVVEVRGVSHLAWNVATYVRATTSPRGTTHHIVEQNGGNRRVPDGRIRRYGSEPDFVQRAIDGAVERAVDAALGEVALQVGVIADVTITEARNAGIAAGQLYVRAIAVRTTGRRDG